MMVEGTGPDASGEAFQIQAPNLILVEGRDEEMFFAALLRWLGRRDVQVCEYGGKSKLRSTLKPLIRQPGWRALQSLVIVRDADHAQPGAHETAAGSAWKSVTGTLEQLGIRPPRAHGKLAEGLLGSGGSGGMESLRTAVFIAPDGVSEGMLEDLCLRAVVEDPAMECLDGYFACLGERGIEVPRHKGAKARAHAFLASRPEPDTRVGEAAKKGYWPWDAPAFAGLVELIRSLPTAKE